MTQITLAVLAFGCATLCVGVAGLLRRITDVKLAFGGYTGEVRQFMCEHRVLLRRGEVGGERLREANRRTKQTEGNRPGESRCRRHPHVATDTELTGEESDTG